MGVATLMPGSWQRHHRLARDGRPDVSFALQRRRRRMKWVTRERPKIDRIACPWLVVRFIDRGAGIPVRAAVTPPTPPTSTRTDRPHPTAQPARGGKAA